MLLTGFSEKRFFRPECNPSFTSLHCIASLSEDISEVLPYLNTAMGGTRYLKNPPEVMFHVHGKIIKVGATEIAVNALKDEAEADKILEWLKTEINQTWEKRKDIVPSEKTPERPKLIEILKLLPKTNCKKCGQPTCMVFAAQAMEGGRGATGCPELSPDQREKLDSYLSHFQFD